MKLIGWKLFIISLALTIPFFAYAITRITKSMQFDNNCTFHIEQALSSDDPKYASNQIDIAVKYLQDHNLTSGYTTIADKDKNEDLSLWYENISKKNAYIHSLETLSPEESKIHKEFVKQMEMKPKFSSENVPGGISIYPHNTFYFVWLMLSLLFGCLGIVGVLVFINETS